MERIVSGGLVDFKKVIPKQKITPIVFKQLQKPFFFILTSRF